MCAADARSVSDSYVSCLKFMFDTVLFALMRSTIITKRLQTPRITVYRICIIVGRNFTRYMYKIQYNTNKIYIAPGILKRIGAQTHGVTRR